MPNDAQTLFDKRYITASEIMRNLDITRSSVHIARTNGRLPDAIDVHGQTVVWERAAITPYLDAWKLMLETRRGY